MVNLAGRRILLGVTGAIAAYKAADLVRRLREAGAEVRVVMSEGATAFVQPLTFQALSGHAVHTHLLDAASEAAMDHIALARWADIVLVAPASANFLARLAHGFAGDLLTTLCLATTAPVAVAPAMNVQMWNNAATKANRDLLTQRGVAFFGPGHGEQACGEVGEGRMREPLDLVADVALRLGATGALQGLSVVITAGPTREPIDPVRVISNRSSGKMGFALADAAARAGAAVTLIAGPVALATPARVERIDVETAAQMQAAVEAQLEKCDILIAAAAVADYRVAAPAAQKLKKDAQSLTLSLVRNPDIIAGVAQRSPHPFAVGFAAETENLAANAQAKLAAKSLDMIAANWVSGPNSGLEGEDNALEVFWRGGHASLPRMSKSALARELIALVAKRFYDNRTAKNS